MEKPSDSPPATFSSLPDDIVLNCLARVSRFYNPTLFLVSKYVRSLIASPDELEATRSRIGMTEDFVCLDVNQENPNPRWFILSLVPKQEKLLPIPCFPYQHPNSSTIVSTHSVIYIIGGFVNGRTSNTVLILDCRSHRWRSLSNMRQPRVFPAADVIDGKLYVIGGSTSNYIEDWGEVYDPKSQTWEPLLPTTLDLTSHKSLVPGRLVMGGKVYAMDGLRLTLKRNVCLLDLTPNKENNICLVKDVLCIMAYSNQNLYWNDPKEDVVWRSVRGLEELSKHPHFHNPFHPLTNSDGGRRIKVWWKSVMSHPYQEHHCTKICKTKIWCAEVSFERRGLRELWGSVEWYKNVFTFDGCDYRCDFLLHSVL